MLVLQGNAATKLRCGGKFYSQLIRKWFLVTTLKELKSANIHPNYSKNKSGTVFLTHSVYLVHIYDVVVESVPSRMTLITWVIFTVTVLLRLLRYYAKFHNYNTIHTSCSSISSRWYSISSASELFSVSICDWVYNVTQITEYIMEHILMCSFVVKKSPSDVGHL